MTVVVSIVQPDVFVQYVHLFPAFAYTFCLPVSNGIYASIALNASQSIARDLFFNVGFDDDHKGIVLSTSPWAPPTHWKQTIFHLKNNVRVSEGQLVDGSFDVKSNSRNERDLDLTVRVQREEEEGV